MDSIIVMEKLAVLIGAAPEGFRQRKMEDMMDFLQTEQGGSYKASEYLGFSGVVTENMLDDVFRYTLEQLPKRILIYFCTRDPVRDYEKVIWCGGKEIPKEMIAKFQNQAKDNNIDLQIIYDVCRDLATEEELGYEPV